MTFSYAPAPTASSIFNPGSTAKGRSSGGVPDWSREFFLSGLMKTLLLIPTIFSAFLFLTLFLFLLIGDLSSLAVQITLASMLTVLTALIALSVWRITKPVLKLSAEGLTVNLPLISRVDFARWEEIDGIVLLESGPSWLREKKLKILVRSEGTTTQEVVFSLKAIERPDEVVALLKEMAPERRGGEAVLAEIGLPLRTEIRFGKWFLSEAGIEGPQGRVRWEQVKSITYPPFVVAGFGAATLTYEAGGREKRVIFQPKIATEYQEFVRVLIHHSRKYASIDPGLVKMLAYAPQEARRELAAIGLALTGILLFFGSMYLIDYFAPPGCWREIWVLLPFFLGLGPAAMMIMALASRFQGRSVPASRKILWAAGFSVSQIAALAILLLSSPFSLHYSLGFFNAQMGQFQAAEDHYQSAYSLRSDHPCLAFDLGLLYRRQENHARAYEFFERAYELDPSYWGPAAIELIPDSLMKLGEYDKGLERCETILQKHRKNREIVQAISAKKNEILQLKTQGAGV